MPTISELQPFLQEFEFGELFVEGLGWDEHNGPPTVFDVNEDEFSLKPIAEKAGFVVYECESGADGEIPAYPVRRKIESRVAKTTFEHMIVFVDVGQREQIWQWVKREAGQPPACREIRFHSGEGGTPILQRLREIAFSLEEEPITNILLVASRVRGAMDVEKVTKRFYDQFRKELTDFARSINGIPDQYDRDWYASLTLNRLMFVYFIQKQGFLDRNTDYLRHRMQLVKEKLGVDNFQEFYRVFLLRLFHEGLGQPESARPLELVQLLGSVPFLNGGLFDVHDLELDNSEISIPDHAFENVFDFFDRYRWHLDERPYREDNEINPDVLGYIFEKYVNQKQMGAYYTKEDITNYIARNTIIPFLFGAAQRECPVAFGPDGGVWRLLQDDPERYIYRSVGHGVTWDARETEKPIRLEKPCDLPDAIADGLNDVSLRGRWNLAAPAEYALPSETWRDVIDRRHKFMELREQIASGRLTGINDLINLNLDIEQFAIDVVAQSEGPELLRAFWKAVSDVSILDPTCGSGAFLFAALNVLEPLYMACLEGMQGFVEDLKRTNRPHRPEALRDFRMLLEDVRDHPNERYFILKSISLNNLFGVDIMEEAVDICKLRLFLKLVAQLRKSEEIEPLPDIDFNIRVGNTLVGFTSLDAVREAMSVTIDGQHRAMFPEHAATLRRIEREAESAGVALNHFRWQQTMHGRAFYGEGKSELREQLKQLSDELDRHLAIEYGIDIDNPDDYGRWQASHQPFHWLAEFHEIMDKGGFDVVIGNPPYVEYHDVKDKYTVRGYRTLSCGNLYAMTLERTIHLAPQGLLGMIVPASSVSTDGYSTLRELLIDAGELIISSYSDNPGKLFSGMPHNRLQIILIDQSTGARGIFTTSYNKWRPDARQYLFENLELWNGTDMKTVPSISSIPKIGRELDASIFRKIQAKPLISKQMKRRSSDHIVYYTRKLGHFLQVLNFIPEIYDSQGERRNPTELKRIEFDNSITRNGALGILNSSTFFWLVTVFSDCRNLNKREVEMIRFDLGDLNRLMRIGTIARDLMEDIQRKSEFKKQGALNIQQTFPRKSKNTIDRLDEILAEHYGFSDDELDYLINFDIKYRMGWTS